MEMEKKKHDLEPEEEQVDIIIGKDDAENIRDLLASPHKEEQICVFLPEDQGSSTEERIKNAKDHLRELRKKYIGKNKDEPWEIEVQKCDHCECPVVLFKSRDPDLITIITTLGKESGTLSPSGNSGEEYSLNYYQKVPIGTNNPIDLNKDEEDVTVVNKEEIVVAVLDTGLDTNLVDPKYLWENTSVAAEPDCYKGAKSGWNFVENCSHFHDDDPGKHGTIVTKYIINEFKKSPNNSVKIMPLKTHNANGEGDLFGILCAIYFAKVKGANIINASWGLYCYEGDPFRLMSRLIKKKLQEAGILFITAAGNRIEAEDVKAIEIFKNKNQGKTPEDHQLRNLDIHHYYPAHLSKLKPDEEGAENTVITVTTTDGKEVCDTQNFSNQFVDVGVQADATVKSEDEAKAKEMKFKVPFRTKPPKELISGSSFATAIATGVIGAYCPKELYSPANPPLKKSAFLNHLISLSGILVKGDDLLPEQIKEGLYIKKR
jgi:hypothetical protein